MLTNTELNSIRKEHEIYVKSVSKALLLARVQRSGHPRQYRSVEIVGSRLSHLYHSLAQEFNKICRVKRKAGYVKAVSSLEQVLSNKYLPTVLSVLDVCKRLNVPLDRWILAQAETIPIPHFTPYHCYGYNAVSRYEGWEARQQKKFLRESERRSQTDSKDKVLTRSVMDSHVTALKWVDTLTSIQAPCISVALWYLWPAVSAWYVLAYPEFRADILDAHLCDAPMLLTKWKTYNRSPHVQEVCEAALASAIAEYGKLEWKRETA